MSRIHGRDTGPEMLLRKALWSRGYRYRVKNRLPGKPDVYFSAKRVAVFVDGCYWHKCPKHYQESATNRQTWRDKIDGNVARDKRNTAQLKSDGWTVIRIWEHDIKHHLDDAVDRIIVQLTADRD